MRLIDADASVERLQRRSDMFYFDKRYVEAIKDAIGEVLTMPTIDAVPVVRCKDCRRWGVGYAIETEKIKCCQFACYMVGENGYCVYAEKKEGDEQ